MSERSASNTRTSSSPDPASHALNPLDYAAAATAWVDEEDDGDDMDFEPASNESEMNEYQDLSEETEAEFQGNLQFKF